MGNIFRTPETSKRYKDFIANGGLEGRCVLCDKETTGVTFTYWRIVTNDYPYDLITERHDMLMPIRHADESELTEEEKAELFDIKTNHLSDYDFVIEPTRKLKSIPEHFHLHVITGKQPNYGND